MDILYISFDTYQKVSIYCEESLINEVLNHFATVGEIKKRKNDEHPNRWWIITDYISNISIDNRKKLSVILSFAAIGGFIQIGDKCQMGNVPVLNMLKELSHISENDYDYFIDAFYNFSQGKGTKFS